VGRTRESVTFRGNVSVPEAAGERLTGRLRHVTQVLRRFDALCLRNEGGALRLRPMQKLRGGTRLFKTTSIHQRRIFIPSDPVSRPQLRDVHESSVLIREDSLRLCTSHLLLTPNPAHSAHSNHGNHQHAT
jgi:hypothetical protein